MKKFRSRLKSFAYENKSTVAVYLLLRALVIFCLITELIDKNYENVFLCILSLVLFLLPFFVEKTFKVELPSILEIIVFLFIFSAEILGEINNFYGIFENWDAILHTINGFLAASIGFSLIYLLNENIESFNLSAVFVAIVAFCFSMTIGVFWEFFEYASDVYLRSDMQKDEIVERLDTVIFNDDNDVEKFDVAKTVIYDQDDKVINTTEGILDIGLHDTMHDLFVNFIGAATYGIFGYLYIRKQGKYKIVESLLVKKRKMIKEV